eukprot:13609-Eustigmatos_ZCMA.PRE.1
MHFRVPSAVSPPLMSVSVQPALMHSFSVPLPVCVLTALQEARRVLTLTATAVIHCESKQT